MTAKKGLTRRVDTARGHSYRLDGRAVDGVTTILSKGVPKPALPNWAARECATFAADNLDLLHNLDRDARIDLVKGAPWRDRDKAARRGIEVHHLCEALARGEEVDVPEELAGHIDAYLRFAAEWAPHDELLELTVLNRSHLYMGTLDLVATLRDGQRWLVDIKTTRSGVYGETALQLAAYRYAEAYLDADGGEQPMPPVDACGVLWLRGDGYDLYPVDAGGATFRAFLYVAQVATYCDVTSKQVVGDALAAPGEDAA